ncbi:MAG TPA: nitrite reductase, partial [Cyclobacteriaceae bacterium]|nr:nitrite reductase [Cyclobacteriaceae bacterium]
PHTIATVADQEVMINDTVKFDRWRATNTFSQKQDGYFGVYVKLPLGNLSSDDSRKFADIIDKYASNELRVTVNQGYLIRYVTEKALKPLYVALDAMKLAEPGFDSVADVTACPGTDSCNLGISDSYGIALALEKVVKEEYPELIYNSDIKIKISGCPNSCGQHGLASIGLHGSTIKDKEGKVLPSLVVLLGGGRLKNGEGIISDKIIKIPSKRGPQALRLLLNDYEANSQDGEYYHDYFKRMDRKHFYDLLKPLSVITNLVPDEYIDWGQENNFILHTAVGECAGVIIDLVATLLYDSDEKLAWAQDAMDQNLYADSIYNSYSSFINTAKALLLTKDIKPSTQYQTINDFQKVFVDSGEFELPFNFKDQVFQINKNEPSAQFARNFMKEAAEFLEKSYVFRNIEREVLVR